MPNDPGSTLPAELRASRMEAALRHARLNHLLILSWDISNHVRKELSRSVREIDLVLESCESDAIMSAIREEEKMHDHGTVVRSVALGAESAEIAHDMSMSKDGQEAAFGRLMKSLMPVLEAWLEEEEHRRDGRPGAERQLDALSAVSNMTVTLACTLAMNIFDIGPEPQMLELMKRSVARHFDAAIRTISERPS